MTGKPPSAAVRKRVDALAREHADAENPLLEIFLALHPDYLVGTDWYMQRGAYGSAYARAEKYRDLLCERFSWSIPNADAIKLLSKLGPLVEIGAGTGYWARLLRARGVDLVAYDRAPPSAKSAKNLWHPNAARFSQVELGGPEKIAAHPERALFLCWPPGDEPMAAECLKIFRGRVVAAIGDGQSVGDQEFVETLQTNFEYRSGVVLPQWMGSSDELRVYRRRRRPLPPLRDDE